MAGSHVAQKLTMKKKVFFAHFDIGLREEGQEMAKAKIQMKSCIGHLHRNLRPNFFSNKKGQTYGLYSPLPRAPLVLWSASVFEIGSRFHSRAWPLRSCNLPEKGRIGFFHSLSELFEFRQAFGSAQKALWP